MSHTKGEWRLNHYHFPYQYIVAHGGEDDNDAFPGQRKICDIWDWNTEKGKANAHLIAAAPDLLAACVEFCQEFSDYGRITNPKTTDWRHSQEYKEQIINKLEGAIAKAKKG